MCCCFPPCRLPAQRCHCQPAAEDQARHVITPFCVSKDRVQTPMPNCCEWLEHDSLCPLFTQIQLASSSPAAIQQDPLPYHASLGSSSGQLLAIPHPADESLCVNTYKVGCLGPSVCPEPACEPRHLLDDCDETTPYSPNMEDSWSSLDEVLGLSFNMPLYPAYPGRATLLDTDIEDLLSSTSTETSYHDMSSACCPTLLSPSYSISDGTYEEDLSDWTSLVLPELSLQSIRSLRCDSAETSMAAMQPVDSQTPVLPSWEEVIFRGLEIDIICNRDPSEASETSYAGSTAPRAQIPRLQAASAPCVDSSGLTDTESRSICSFCHKKFSHSGDLIRHVKTKHDKAGKGYRCAFAGCSKVHKVWSRLDSFKKHVRNQHQIEDAAEIKSLVAKSATGEHGLPIAMTSLSREHAGSPASRVHHSVTL